MDEISKIIGLNVKRLRKERSFSLDDLAVQTGISKSSLSQIEKGDGNPTVANLWKLAHGLGVAWTTLTELGREKVDVVHLSEVHPIIDKDGAIKIHPIFPFDPSSKFEFFHKTMEHGSSTDAEGHGRVQEILFIYEGEVEVHVQGRDYRLKKGDAIRFMADGAHSYKAVGKKTTSFLSMLYYLPEAN